MGYFNINSILYNFRKIFKYLSISLAFISFIILALLLMTRDVKAVTYTDSTSNTTFYIDDYFYEFIQNSSYYNNSYDYFAWAFWGNNEVQWNCVCVPSNTYDYIADYNTSTGVITWNPNINQFYIVWTITPLNVSSASFSERNYILSQNAWFDNNRTVYKTTNNDVTLNYVFGSNGSVKLNGVDSPRPTFPTTPIPTPTPTPTPSIPSSFNYPPFPSNASNFNSQVVTYFRRSGTYLLSLCTSVPVANTNLGYLRFQTNGQNYVYNPSTDSDWVFDGNFPQYDIIINFSDIASGGFNPVIYTNEDILYYGSYDVWLPATSTFRVPFIALPNDTTQAYISGEFSQFMVIGNTDIEDLQFFLTANPDVLPTTNSLALNLDDDSPYYLNNFEAEDGGKYYLIPKYDLPQGYTNDTLYHAWLAYRYNNQVYLTDVIEWTTDFTPKAIENDRIRMESGMADSLSDVRSFLFNKKVNYGDYNLPNITFDFDQEHFLSDLFDNIKDAFIGNTYTDFEFTFPFSEETITIPSNYVELHCPSIIVNLIRLFYWYIIGRYILKDVFRTIDKMRQGDWFLRSDGNIKTEVL